MPKAKQITVRLPNRPGSLARVAEALAVKRVNITGFAASEKKGRSPIRLLVSNPRRALQALRAAKIQARVDTVLLVTLPDRPGRLARVARKLAAAGVNIHYGYGTVARGGKRAAIVMAVSSLGRGVRVAR